METRAPALNVPRPGDRGIVCPMVRDDDPNLIRARRLLGSTRDAPVSRRTLEPVEALPGVVEIFAGGRPARRLFPVGRGTLVLGRIELAEGDFLDESISR